MRWFVRYAAIGSVFGCSGMQVRGGEVREPRHVGPVLGDFVPGTADPARRARLEALAPELDAFFESKLKETGATGLATGIVIDGELAYARGFGVQDVSTRTPIDRDSVFRIASMTKSFTALAMLKLRDEGKVSLDEPAERYLPEIGALVAPTADSPPITLRLLLTNSSGLAYDDLWGAVSFGKTQKELVELLKTGVQMPNAPGTRYAYSNLGWALLGQVVARVSKVGFREYVDQNVLRPLGMKASVWETTAVPPSRLAIGYRHERGELVPEPRESDGAFDAAGGLYTSLRDYSRYLAFQLAAYPPRNDPETGPVRRSTLREMHEGQRLIRSERNTPFVKVTEEGATLGVASYGLGWANVTTCVDEGRVQHGGFEPGYYNWVVMMPNARIGWVALATSGPVGITARYGVFDILRKAGLLTPPRATPHPVLVEARSTLPSLLGAWDPALAARTFDPDSSKYSWNTNLRERFGALSREHGACRAQGELEVHSPLHADLRLACERGAINFELILSPETPPRFQHVGITEELAPDERTERMAKLLAAALGGPEDQVAAEMIASGADRERIRKALRRARQSFTNCIVDHGAKEVAYGPWSTDHTTRYRLQCDQVPVELTLGLDDTTGQLTSFAAYSPRASDALCWQ